MLFIYLFFFVLLLLCNTHAHCTDRKKLKHKHNYDDFFLYFGWMNIPFLFFFSCKFSFSIIPSYLILAIKHEYFCHLMDTFDSFFLSFCSAPNYQFLWNLEEKNQCFVSFAQNQRDGNQLFRIIFLLCCSLRALSLQLYFFKKNFFLFIIITSILVNTKYQTSSTIVQPQLNIHNEKITTTTSIWDERIRTLTHTNTVVLSKLNHHTWTIIQWRRCVCEL